MNKDVIYIEPEDDITDIITKIEKAKNKIVALVPPKKAGVFRSIVNIKLIAKAGASAGKTIVIVTTDPSITKLATATKIPVTENLQSAPSVPVVSEDDEPETEKEEAEESEEETAEEETEEEPEEDEATEEEEESEDDEEEEEDEKDKKAKAPKKSTKLSNNKFVAWIQEHKKMAILAGSAAVVLIVFMIWAFAIAPAVDINVAIKTDQKNFSESVTFVTNLADENAEEGKFYMEEKKLEFLSETTFEATGQKNVGEKATGDVVIYTYFEISKGAASIAVNAGSSFTINKLTYIANEESSLSWDGDLNKLSENCENYGQASLNRSGCLKSRRVKVTAAKSGAEYNIAAQNSGWSTTAPVAVYSDKAMSGGSDKMVTVVQQSDIDKAKEMLGSSNASENKALLYEEIREDQFTIEASFKQTTSEAVSVPALGEEIKEDEAPILKVTTTATVFVVDKVKLEEFINSKAKLEEGQKLYKIKDFYMESFIETTDHYTAKLKAHYFVGPRITEGELVERILGKGLGDARREISDIHGVSDVTMNPSFPWVMSVPNDSNKVNITFEFKDQNGNVVKDENKENVSEE